MPYFTYDTSVVISRKMGELPGRTGSFLWSSLAGIDGKRARRFPEKNL